MRSTVATLAILVILSNSAGAHAEGISLTPCSGSSCLTPIEQDNLQERIADCEAALDLADKALNGQADLITQLSNQNARLEHSLDYATAELAREKSWFRDPKVLAPAAMVLGVALGAYAAKSGR